MSAMDACEVVKHKVPDANDKGKQIECWIAYRPGSVTLAETKIDTKVIIFAYEKNNHGAFVSCDIDSKSYSGGYLIHSFFNLLLTRSFSFLFSYTFFSNRHPSS